MRAPRWLGLALLLSLFGPAVLAPPSLAPRASAQDDEGDEGDDDEFDTSWIGVRLGFWYRPTIDMDVQVSGLGPSNPLTGLLGTDFNLQRDLGVRENPRSEYSVDFDHQAIPELELFVETEWVSLFVLWIPPFEYQGRSNLTRTVSFGGQSFSATTQVESKFRHMFLGADVEFNIFNNGLFRLSPLIGARALIVDYEVRDLTTGVKGDTSDIDSPLHFEEWEVFPYPEVGIDFRIGAREWIEAGIKLAGSLIDYYGVEGGTFRAEATVTAYPIPFLGIQVGARHLLYDIKSKDEDGDRQFDFDLEFIGFTASLIVRFG